MCMVRSLALPYTFNDTHLSLAQSTDVPSPPPERASLHGNKTSSNLTRGHHMSCAISVSDFNSGFKPKC